MESLHVPLVICTSWTYRGTFVLILSISPLIILFISFYASDSYTHILDDPGLHAYLPLGHHRRSISSSTRFLHRKYIHPTLRTTLHSHISHSFTLSLAHVRAHATFHLCNTPATHTASALILLLFISSVYISYIFPPYCCY